MGLSQPRLSMFTAFLLDGWSRGLTAWLVLFEQILLAELSLYKAMF